MKCKVYSARHSSGLLERYPCLINFGYESADALTDPSGIIELESIKDLNTLIEQLKMFNEDDCFHKGVIVDIDPDDDIPMYIVIYDDYVE